MLDSKCIIIRGGSNLIPNTPYRQLRVKDLPKVPMWRLETIPAIMSGDSKTLFLNRRQLLVAEETALSCSGHHSSRADVLRNLMLMTEFARATNLMSDDACSHTFHTLADTYSYLVDSPDNGLNNYADGAFACVDGVRNETSQWKTSLRFETSQNLDCVKKFMASSKAARSFLESGAKADDPIGWNVTDPPTSLNQQDLSDPMVRRSVQPAVSCGAGSNQGLLRPVSGLNHAQTHSSSGAGVVHSSSGSTTSGQRNSGESKRPMVGSASCRSSMVRAKPMRLEDITPDESQDESQSHRQPGSSFKSALHLLTEQKKKIGGFGGNTKELSPSPASYGASKKSLGARPGPCGKFIPPSLNRDDSDDSNRMSCTTKTQQAVGSANEEPVDPRLKNIEPRMIELITSEIMDHGPLLGWDDIAGLEFVKKTIKEIVIWPMLRPDIFTGLRGPPKGLLLFGPPGTGKTLIGKCIASQSKSTFFSISASSLTSKWVGESEKMVRALFAVARVQQPSVVFIDEIDSLLSQRSDGEHDSSRRIKTEFLVQLDGASTSQDDRILVVGATNRPQEIDEAARRRFVKRLYIPLPDEEARRQIVLHLMAMLSHVLTDSDLATICDKTQGYSGADMANLCREAALGPIRSLPFQDIESIAEDEVRPVECRDFMNALQQVRASVSDKDLDAYLEWNSQYGSWAL